MKREVLTNKKAQAGMDTFEMIVLVVVVIAVALGMIFVFKNIFHI